MPNFGRGRNQGRNIHVTFKLPELGFNLIFICYLAPSFLNPVVTLTYLSCFRAVFHCRSMCIDCGPLMLILLPKTNTRLKLYPLRFVVESCYVQSCELSYDVLGMTQNCNHTRESSIERDLAQWW